MASRNDTGFITPDDQQISGTKTLLSSPVINTLHPGSVVFLGSNDSLSEDNGNLFWDNTHKELGVGTNSPGNSLDIKSNSLGKSGLTLTNLNSSVAVTDASAQAIGVNTTGEVVRVNTAPIYYNSNGDVLAPQVQKILVDSLTSTASTTVSEVRTIDISKVGFTKILSIQVTGKIVLANGESDILYSIIPSVLDYNSSQVIIRVLELKIGGSGLVNGLIANLIGASFQVPSAATGILGATLVTDPKPYTIYYRIEGY
jgi:hypothetical protein